MAYEDNLILDLSFDLPAGTSTVPDTSPSGVTGNVVACEFVAGEDGHNCIKFDGQGYVEILEDIVPIAGDFTLLARLKYAEMPNGTDGKKFGFFLNFGDTGSREVWLNIPSATWGNIAVVKEGLTARIYWNADLLETITLPVQPVGVAFLQDIYSTDYGYGYIASVKGYNAAIPIEEPEPGDPVYEISVQPSALSFIAAGQTKAFAVTATKDGQPVGAEVVSKPDWVAVNLTNSQATAQANTGNVRTGNIVLRPVSGNVSASIAITQAAASVDPEPGTPSPTLEYYIDGTNFKDWGIYVSESNGLLDRPKLKAPLKVDWDDYHGEVVDLRKKRVEAREITLNCFMKADGKLDFATKLNTFLDVFSKDGTQRLTVEIDPEKPLIYEVYNESGISISKRWNDDLMVGTFSLKLKEPEPVKRIVKFEKTGTATTHIITLSSNKTVTIYWGDGTKTEDVYGDNLTVTHTYTSDGDYFTVIAGVIEDVRDFTTNGIIVWNKL